MVWFRSSDSGQSWEHVFTVPDVQPGVEPYQYGLRRIRFAPSNNQVVYGGSCRGEVGYPSDGAGKGVFRSASAGADGTWFAANDSKIEGLCITDLAVDPFNHNLVYAATKNSGVFKTTDGGANWTQTGLTFDTRAIAVHPSVHTYLLAGVINQGIYESTDSGATWTPFNNGMEPNDYIRAIVFDPGNPQVAWAASMRSGVYRWEVTENRWAHINSGLRTRAVTSLAISPDGGLLYAGTSGEGVFRFGDPPPSWPVYLPLIVR